MRNHARDGVPQRLDGVLRLGEAWVVHTQRVVGNVVEVGVIVHAQVRHVTPRRLVVVRRPVAERAWNPHARAVVQFTDPASILEAYALRAGWRREQLAVRLRRHRQSREVAARHLIANATEVRTREDRVAVCARTGAARLAIGHVFADPVEPVRVLPDPIRVTRRGTQHELHHDEQSQVMRRLDQPGKQRIDVHAQRRLGQPLVELVRVADRVGRPQRALLAVLPHRVDRQQVDSVDVQALEVRQQCDSLEQCARVAPAIHRWLDRQIVVVRVVVGGRQARQQVIDHGAARPFAAARSLHQRLRIGLENRAEHVRVEFIGIDGARFGRLEVEPEARDVVWC